MVLTRKIFKPGPKSFQFNHQRTKSCLHIHYLTGNTWEQLECLDENQHGALQSKESVKLGEFPEPYGKEDCLVVCRIFGLTGCEWKIETGECYAHMKEITIGNNHKYSWCYTFNIKPTLGKMV